MIRLYPNASVLTNHHPFRGTDMMTRRLASALDANGYDALVVDINCRDLTEVPRALTAPGSS